MKEKMRSLLRHETVRYFVAGGGTTIFNLTVFGLLCWVLTVEVNLSNFISVALSIFFAYTVNKLYVFDSRCENLRQLIGEFAKFVGARLITMAIEVGGVYLLYSVLDLHEMVSKLATQLIVLVANYLISKLLVFRKKKE